MIHFPQNVIGSNLLGRVAKLSPLFTVVLILSVIESGPGSGAWDEIWRLFMSVGLGILVTLLGMIYHNMDRRVTAMEEDHVGRLEYDKRHEELVRHLERIETHIEKVDERIHNGV